MIRNHSYLLLIAAALLMASCSRSVSRYDKEISRAEKLMESNPDSALTVLGTIDPAELTVDSIKAKYHYVIAYAHDCENHVALSDSMIQFSTDYYRGKDLKRSIRSTTLLASYKFRIGERQKAIRMLDSLSSLTDVPDTLLIDPLRSRVNLGTYFSANESKIKRLLSIDKDKNWHHQYKYWLYFSYLFDGKNDSALVILDDLIRGVIRSDDSEKVFRYKYEKMGVLEEMGRYAESRALADSLMNEPMGENIRHYFYLWEALALVNMHDFSSAKNVLAKADSLATAIDEDERGYYNSFAYVVHILLDFQDSRRASFLPLARINNSQRDKVFDATHTRYEAAQRALEIENQRLILKSKNDRQTAMIIIIVLGALIICGALIWYAFSKKRKALEALEGNEVLQKLVDESKASKTDMTVNESLRKAMLQQLGIIKMVAETPTPQNREMLRKLSSVENDTDVSLVNWESVYGMIDNLYSGFYSRLHERHGSVLTDKEEQIIALMVAGFSTKEISVITGQTAATIYVRKSSVRKKLGVAEKEDIVAFLRQDTDY